VGVLLVLEDTIGDLAVLARPARALEKVPCVLAKRMSAGRASITKSW
jgi:hypothetical protein